MSDPRTMPGDQDGVIVALNELVEALDRRMPDMARLGESHIREQAAVLRTQALSRIQGLAEAGADATPVGGAVADAVMTDDGAPVPVVAV